MYYINVEDRNELFIEKFIEKLEKKTDMFEYIDKDYYAAFFMEGRYLAWINGNVMIIGKPSFSDTRLKILELDTASLDDNPEHDSFEECIKHIEVEAKMNGFDEIRFTGRRGWAKIYPDYRELHTTFVKEL